MDISIIISTTEIILSGIGAAEVVHIVVKSNVSHSMSHLITHHSLK